MLETTIDDCFNLQAPTAVKLSIQRMESLTAFLDEFNSLMTYLAILPGNVIVAGDFNFHNHNITAVWTRKADYNLIWVPANGR